MPKILTDNASSADNQQGRVSQLINWGRNSPQRLYAEYPKEKKITSQEATLLGILYTDGCLSRKSKNCWRFFLGNTSFEIIRAFKSCMIKVFGLDSQRVRISEKLVNGKPYYIAIVDSGYHGSLLTARYGTFRTLAFRKEGKKVHPPTRLPFASNTNKSIISQFLKTAFSCDGGVCLYVAKSKDNYKFLIRNIFLSCHHPQLRSDYQQLLSILGIESKNLIKDKKILIQGRLRLEKFRKKVGFLDGVKITQHSAYWQGWEKNKVLDLALSSYGNAKKIICLPQFLG